MTMALRHKWFKAFQWKPVTVLWIGALPDRQSGATLAGSAQEDTA
jgi:hypothetical protein